MSTYTEQAEQFLRDTETTFTIEYQYTGRHFEGDKEKRDVYRFTLRNVRGEYSANFGNSIQETEDRAIAAKYRTCSTWHSDKREEARIKAAIKRHKERPKPTAYDVLACLQKSDVGSFNDFCADFGYDDQPLSTYPAVMKTYDAVCTEYAALRRMFTPEQLEKLQEVQ